MQYGVIEEQFKLLFDSIQTISNAKNLEDKFMQQIKQWKGHHQQLLEDNTTLHRKVKDLTDERDQFRRETRDLLDLKYKIEREKSVAMEAFKKRMSQMEKDLAKSREELEKAFQKVSD